MFCFPSEVLDNTLSEQVRFNDSSANAMARQREPDLISYSKAAVGLQQQAGRDQNSLEKTSRENVDAVGRQQVAHWKRGAGRSKEWRSSKSNCKENINAGFKRTRTYFGNPTPVDLNSRVPGVPLNARQRECQNIQTTETSCKHRRNVLTKGDNADFKGD